MNMRFPGSNLMIRLCWCGLVGCASGEGASAAPLAATTPAASASPAVAAPGARVDTTTFSLMPGQTKIFADRLVVTLLRDPPASSETASDAAPASAGPARVELQVGSGPGSEVLHFVSPTPGMEAVTTAQKLARRFTLKEVRTGGKRDVYVFAVEPAR